MARGCPPEPDLYYQRQRSGPFALTRSGHHNYSLPQRPAPNMSQMDPDGKGQPRKRIAVACSRCRKRKIKCSGDRGDGQGCTNCKNSSNGGPSACQFLRVQSQDIGTFHLEAPTVVASPGAYTSGVDMGYYGQNYYPQPPNLPASQGPRMPRHYASNVFYSGGVTMMPETPGRHTETLMDSFPYSGSGPSGFNSVYQANMYSQPDNVQYYPQNSGYQRSQVENEGFRYPSTTVNHVSGSNVSDAHSQFPGMDNLAHSLPGSCTAQRTLPTPRNSNNTVVDYADKIGQLQPQQQPVLKSQGVGSLGSYSSTPLIPPANSEAPPDNVSALTHQYSNLSHAQPRPSVRSSLSEQFPDFWNSSSRPETNNALGSVTAGQYHQQKQVSVADMGPPSSTVLAGDEGYNSTRTFPPMDPRIESSRSESSSNTSSVQYNSGSSNGSLRSSQGSLFTAFEDDSRDGKRNSVASSSGSAPKKWET